MDELKISQEAQKDYNKKTYDKNKYEGIKGWLILVLFNLFIYPIYYCGNAFDAFELLNSESVKKVFLTPGKGTYIPMLDGIMIYEIIGSLILVAISIVALILLFKKKKEFPPVIISFYILNLVYITIDNFLIKFGVSLQLSIKVASIQEIFGAVIQLFIWGKYFLSSKRVEATFVK